MRLGFWAIEIGVQRILPSPLWFPRRVTREGEKVGRGYKVQGAPLSFFRLTISTLLSFLAPINAFLEVVENAIYNTRLLEEACERTEYRLFISNNLFICLFRKMLASFYANYQNTKNIKFFIKVI